MERTMTLASFGGPDGAVGAADADATGAATVLALVTGAVEAVAATVGVCDPGWAGGASFEQAAPARPADTTARRAMRCIEAMVFTSTPTPTQALRACQDSTVICSFCRISRYSSLML
jgi:hypothetical protein